MTRFCEKLAVSFAYASLLAGCGGGSGTTASSTPTVTSNLPTTSAPSTSSAPAAPPSNADASRFLEQATFGVAASDVAHLQSVGFNAYLSEQLSAPISQ